MKSSRAAKVSLAHANMKCCNPPEPVVKQEYDYKTKQWTSKEIWVQLGAQPFQEGTLRFIYYLLDLSLPEGQQECAAKLSKNPIDSRESYFQDVLMHAKAKSLADEYNSHNPPKQVDFVLPVVMEFKLRKAPNGRGCLHMNVEPFLHGTYKKYSNNFGFVSHDVRNTPHAFSHFTFHATGGKMLVCDIQGVDDMYTDPQIHSVDMLRKWGKGDMGLQGIIQFFNTHHCSSICEYFQLPKPPRKGTIPPVSNRNIVAASCKSMPLRSVQLCAATAPAAAAAPVPVTSKPVSSSGAISPRQPALPQRRHESVDEYAKPASVPRRGSFSAAAAASASTPLTKCPSAPAAMMGRPSTPSNSSGSVSDPNLNNHHSGGGHYIHHKFPSPTYNTPAGEHNVPSASSSSTGSSVGGMPMPLGRSSTGGSRPSSGNGTANGGNGSARGSAAARAPAAAHRSSSAPFLDSFPVNKNSPAKAMSRTPTKPHLASSIPRACNF